MNLNFFDWLRDAVRRTVLAGMGDAVEQIGMPKDDESMSPQVAALFATEGTGGESSPTTAKKTTNRRRSTTTKKRLGKSLKDMEPIAKK
ncbi:MAG: hypothetical protein AAF664_12790 [Planctomycetota bacterium]